MPLLKLPRNPVNSARNKNTSKYYTIHHVDCNNPYLVQVHSRHVQVVPKSSIVGFRDIEHASGFCDVIESYRNMTQSWMLPLMEIDLFANDMFVDATTLNYKARSLYLREWQHNDISNYCAKNILDLLLISHDTNNNAAYQVNYKCVLYNIESSQQDVLEHLNRLVK